MSLSFYAAVWLGCLVLVTSAGSLDNQAISPEVDAQKLFLLDKKLAELIQSQSSTLYAPKPFSKTLNISLNHLWLRNIEDIDEDKGKIILVMTLEYHWKSHWLRWNSTEFKSDCVVFAADAVWTPSFSACGAYFWQDANNFPINEVRMCSDGWTGLYSGLRIAVQVDFEPRDFPFDHQTVEFCITPSMAISKGLYVDLVFPNETEGRYQQMVFTAEDRALSALYIWRKTGTIQCHRQYWGQEEISYAPSLYCSFGLSRVGLYYVWEFCLPTSLVTLLALVGLFVQSYKADGQKVSPIPNFHLSAMVLMSLSVMALSIVNSVPKVGTLIRIEIYYYGLITVLFAAAITFGGAVSNMGGKRSKPLKVFLFLLFMLGYIVDVLWFIYPVMNRIHATNKTNDSGDNK